MDGPEENAKWYDELDERQQKEVTLARMYARDFHHGTNGHNSLMLIAKMAEKLDVQEAQLKELGF